MAVAQAQQLDVEKMFEERNLGPVTEMLAHGEYELVARVGEAAVEKGLKAPEWRIMRLKALVELGRIEEALEESRKALAIFPGHFELLMLRHDFAKMLGQSDVAAEALKAFNQVAKAKAPKERTAMETVMLGRAALVLGADAQKVISQYFKAAQGKDAKLEAAYLAEGHLALDKDDAKRAAEVFRAGLKAHGETAEMRFGLAKAFGPSDHEKAVENLAKALELNPNHKAAHLLRARGREEGRCGAHGGAEALGKESGGGSHDRTLSIAGVSFCRECRTSAQSAGDGRKLPASEGAALPRSAAAG